MKYPTCLIVCLFLPIAALCGGIEGKVLNEQGAAVVGATVTASRDHGTPAAKAITGLDGTFAIPNLASGVYTVTVSIATPQQTLRREVSVGNADFNVRADFRAAQNVAGISSTAEEYNPNIFIFRIDQNQVRNRLQTARGPDPQYVPEFSAEQNFFGAEFGAPILEVEPFRPRALIRDWRGSAVAFLQNSALNARNFFNVGPLLASRSSSYGITAGGPVFSRKTSLLLQFGQNFTSGMVNGNAQVPLASERIPLAADPRTAAVIGALLKAYSPQLPNLPNVSPRQLNSNAPRDIKSVNAQSRLDWKPSDRIAYAFRYSANDYAEDPFQIVLGQNPETNMRTQTADASATKTFSASTLAQFDFRYERTALRLEPTSQYAHLLTSAGYSAVPDILFASTPITYSELYNIGPGPQFPRRRVENQFQYSGSLVRSMGRHTLKAGLNIIRNQVNDLQSDNARGSFVFGSDFGRTLAQNFLQGTPSSFTIALGNLYRGYRNWEHIFFLEDEIRVSTTLSLSLGARYELMTVPQEVNHLYDVGLQPDHNNVAPRFGFAWNPGKGKTTIRGAYGISYGTISTPTYGFSRFNEPLIQVVSVSAPDLITALNGGYQTTNRTARYLLSPDLQVPYSHQYSFSIERSLPLSMRLRVAYFGSRSFHLLVQDAFNRAAPVPGIPLTTATVNQRRPDQRYTGVYQIDSRSNAYFDVAQVSVDKRLSHGFTVRASYSFSKAIDTGGDFTNNAANGQNIGEAGLPTCEHCDYTSDHKAVSLFDTPQAASFSYTYSVPSFLQGNGWRAAISRRWQISGTTIFQSGTPYHVHTGSDAAGFGNVDGEGQDRPNITNPSILGKSIDNPDTSVKVLGADTCVAPNVPDQNGNVYPYVRCLYFDTNLPPGGRGNLGMNTFRKKGTKNTNLAVGRTFRLPGDRERTLQFRTEFINLFNHPQFDKGGNVMSSLTTFAKITNTVNKGRQVQFSLRLNF